jgi:hypothetical protein
MSLPSGGKPLAAGDWINRNQLDVSFGVQVATGSLVPQAEIRPSDQPFTGAPNFTAAPMTASGTATVHLTGLLNAHTYHWQARVDDGAGHDSNWIAFGTSAGSADVGIDQTPPSRPVLRSPNVPDQQRWYNAQSVVLRWKSNDSLSGIVGYRFVLQHTAKVISTGAVAQHTGVRISNLPDGTWFAAVRAEDRAGNWSATATFRVNIDRSPPRITWLSPKRLAFNPIAGPAAFKFKVNKPSSASFDLYRVGSGHPVATFGFRSLAANQTATITWSGKGARGKTVPSGFYFFTVRLVDQADNVTKENLGGIDVHPNPPVRAVTGELLFPDGGKRIIVWLSRQALYAYDGTHLVLQTLVTTGNPALPTPPGTYTVQAKYTPFQFNSPWPPGSPYWYAPSWVTYAMLFRDGGYFLHDAPWRSVFGPGSNGAGQPGTNYGGTHGCVNIPPGPMGVIWNFAPVGTVVEVVP